jgi:hypothetical protein
MEVDTALKDLGITSQQMGVLLSMRRGVAATPFESVQAAGDRHRPDDAHARQAGSARACSNGRRSLEDRRVVNLESDRARVPSWQRACPDIAPVVLNARLKKFSRRASSRNCAAC